ncbi:MULTISPECIES: S-methyl-5-thioribose-1-phosphate isomerase [Hydrocarboniphaga]|jgi:methylthioribose-1-phosphate isomerase|uniref:Methylthioribose-1-phosphate isomerase n=1 Tax=Hydrocarboniphaga effusa AP103 TaxID=1172194 RepID=I8T411_9GAMM|nr:MULTISPECIES: S-methyl-5-thioribose-1-phosphate isomerase [Hydrocarboniphaga]EIT68438.1 translation initiation factor 2B subunit I [Hydrocarboniphaga effusa AP103]MDZ4078577.1 S-methyl-5-thioribose-1-phosphate isomerase [Hydrocarboniphaga sp.]
MTASSSATGIRPIIWADDHLKLIDQRVLPNEERWVDCRSAAEVADAIHGMAVRGAPAIGIAAAYGLVLDALAGRDYEAADRVLMESRPTAVNLRWALLRMRELKSQGADAKALLAEAIRIHEEDLAQNLAMGEAGAALLPPNAVVITHCNTGALATGGHGTALGVIRSAWARGRLSQVYNGETRPWLQGARLTAWELLYEKIPARLIADGAAAHLMQREKIDWVIVGADRIAVNGDTANKIGTYALAVAARHHGVKFMVVAPSGTFDLNCPNGAAIPIEERPPNELTEFRGSRIAPEAMQAWNPVFDVTPASLIDAIVCERGVIEQPTEQKIRALLG